MVIVLERPDTFHLSFEVLEINVFALDFGRDHRIFDIDPREGASHGVL